MMEFFRPPPRGFTVPMLATFASAASRACRSGVKSGSATLPGPFPPEGPLGFRARTRSRISAITAASSSPLASIARALLLLAPVRGDLGENAAPRSEFAGERGFHRLASLHHVAQEAVHHVFLENSQIAIRQHVHLEGLQL